jgi:hypothetical protein
MSDTDFTNLDLGPLRAAAKAAQFTPWPATGHPDQDPEAEQ